MLLDQEKKEKCKDFLASHVGKIYVSDFSLHSIGVIVFRFGKAHLFKLFIEDILPKITLLTLPVEAYTQLSSMRETTGLDFDDSYQLGIAS